MANNSKIGKIEKGVPIPENKNPSSMYPFEKMEVGDSIRIEGSVVDCNKARSAAGNFSKKSGMKFKTRSSVGEIRVWRVK